MDDLVQEGLIAAISALRSYNPERGSLQGYVRVCARNKMVSYMRRNRHELPMDEESLIDSLDSDNTTNLEGQRETVEIYEALSSLVVNLSNFERKVLAAYLTTGGASEAARILLIDRKKVDNALQRIRNKARMDRFFSNA